MRSTTLLCATLLSLAAGGLFKPSAAHADWLVGKDGSRLEIKGPWTVKGRVVTFNLPNGTLGSLKLTEVDLEKSAQVTAESQAAAAAAAPEKQPAAKSTPVFVLRDEDVQHLSPDTLEPVTSDQTAPADAAPTTPVQVSAWDKGFSQVDNGAMVTGTVRNTGKQVAAGINVTVKVYDEQGRLVGTAPVTLSADTLPPGQAASFRAVLPGVESFMAAKFDIESTPVQTSPEASETEEPEEVPPQ